MDIKDSIGVFKTIAQVLRDTTAKEAETTANDTLALVRDRVQNDKENYLGQAFGQYSPVSEQIREDNNLFGGDINFTFTGEMWASASVRLMGRTNGDALAIVEFVGEHNKAKAEKNSARFGSIIRASQDELDIVREAYQERRLDLIEQLLNF